MFTPLDILYIVLAFCVLWFTVAIFWLIWQVASIFRNVNETLLEAREKMHKIEQALTAIKERFEKASSVVTLGANAVAKVVEYAIGKKFGEDKEEGKSKKKRKK